MALYNNQRPGVYSTYSVSSRYATPRSALAAALVCRGDASLAGHVITLTTSAQAASLLTGGDSATALACSQILLESGVSKVYLSIVGEQYAPALNLIEETADIGALVCDADTPDNLRLLKASVEGSSEKLYERVAFAGIRGSETALAAAEELVSERVVLCCPDAAKRGTDSTHPVYGAAALAGRILAAGNPALNLNGAALEPLAGTQSLSEREVQSLITGGVTVLETVGSHVECVRAVTTRAIGSGAPDNSLRPLNTILIIDDIMRGLRLSLKAKLGGLRRHAGLLDAILSQVMVELAAKVDEGIIEGFETPLVYASAEDPSVCIVEISFSVAHLVDQIHISAHVEV